MKRTFTQAQKSFSTAAEMQAYRAANFHNYKPEYDIELKALLVAEAIAAPALAAEAARQAIKRERAATKKLNNQRNRQARGDASRNLKDARNRGR